MWGWECSVTGTWAGSSAAWRCWTQAAGLQSAEAALDVTEPRSRSRRPCPCFVVWMFCHGELKRAGQRSIAVRMPQPRLKACLSDAPGQPWSAGPAR